MVKTFDRRVSLKNSKGNIHQGDKERKKIRTFLLVSHSPKN